MIFATLNVPSASNQPAVIGSIGLPVGCDHDLAHVLARVEAGFRSELPELGIVHRQMREHVLAEGRGFGLRDLESGEHLRVGHHHLEQGRIGGGESAQGKGEEYSKTAEALS